MARYGPCEPAPLAASLPLVSVHAPSTAVRRRCHADWKAFRYGGAVHTPPAWPGSGWKSVAGGGGAAGGGEGGGRGRGGHSVLAPRVKTTRATKR